MTDISGIFSISSSTNPQWISLCGHLEAVIGNYLLSQAGNPEAYWYAIYYDSSVDGYNECVEITDKNLIGYVYCDDRVAFVLNSFLERFINTSSTLLPSEISNWSSPLSSISSTWLPIPVPIGYVEKLKVKN